MGSSAKLRDGSVTRAFSKIAGFEVIPRDQNPWRCASRDLSFFNCLFASLIPGELLLFLDKSSELNRQLRA